MFHNRTSLITGIVTLLCLTAQPTLSYANGPTSPAAQTQTKAQSQPSHMLADKKLTDMSLGKLRQGTKAKISETQEWVEDQKAVENVKGFVQDMGQATDRLQDSVAPVGNSIKSSIKASFPEASLVSKGDSMFSGFGLLLFMAFAFVVLLMSLSSPISRLGGRH